MDKFAGLYHLHNGSEGYKLVPELLVALLSEHGGMLVHEGMVVLQAVSKELYGKCGAFLVILFQQTAHTIIMKQAGSHYFRDMYFLHPLHPAFMDVVGNLAGNVVNDHTVPGWSSR